MPFFIDDELAAFLTRGNSIVVATRDAALVPHATRACGLRVSAPDRIEILLPRASSAQALANLQDNGDIAVCASWPLDFRTVQLKGRCLALREGSPADLVLSEQQLHGFAAAISSYGNSRAQARNLWLFDSFCVAMRVTAAFAQTPGPGAGAAMEVTVED